MFTSGRADIGANVANPWNERAITAEISELGLPWARQALEIPLASLYETELDVPKHRARRMSDLYFDRQLRDRLSLSLPGILHTRPAGGAGGLLVRPRGLLIRVCHLPQESTAPLPTPAFLPVSELGRSPSSCERRPSWAPL